MAPLDRRLEGPLTRQLITTPTNEEPIVILKFERDALRGQLPAPRRRQFNRQWDPVNPPANSHARIKQRFSHHELRAGTGGPIPKQALR